MKFRKHFDYDISKASDEAAISFVGEESLTIQSMAEDADINVLMARYGVTGVMPSNPKIPVYGDFTDIKDYRSALHAVSDAYDSFMELPAFVRSKFDNDPQKLLDFCANDANIEEARSLGLLKEKVNGESDRGSSGSGVSGGESSKPPATAGGA